MALTSSKCPCFILFFAVIDIDVGMEDVEEGLVTMKHLILMQTSRTFDDY